MQIFSDVQKLVFILMVIETQIPEFATDSIFLDGKLFLENVKQML
jgi:hypothetical protein